MPNKFDKWLPKFSRNNVITAKEHIGLFYYVFGSCYIGYEDVFMSLFSLSLQENEKL
jgi:hypothetical protein